MSAKRSLSDPPVHPIPHDHARKRAADPVCVPRQIEPLWQLDLRHQQKDRRGHAAPAGFRPRRHRAAPGVQPSFGHQEAWPPAAIDKPQPQARPAFPFTGGDAASAGAFSSGRRWDRQPEA